jgi:leucyl-tRNA synthetase
MIHGRSNFVYRIKGSNTLLSLYLKEQYDVTPIHVDVNIGHNDILDIEAFRTGTRVQTAEFILEDENISADGLLRKCRNRCSTWSSR